MKKEREAATTTTTATNKKIERERKKEREKEPRRNFPNEIVHNIHSVLCTGEMPAFPWHRVAEFSTTLNWQD